MNKITIEKTHPNFKEPIQEPGSVGLDCFVAEVVIENGSVTYDLGFKASPPKGYYLMLVPRSSILKYDLVMPNSPGIIDPNYRGNLLFKCKPIMRLEEFKNERYAQVVKDYMNPNYYKVGDKCCQLILQKIESFTVQNGTLDETNRKGGFGSTGK